jgi:tetratricopeptide (TPR) repeat protein
MPVEENQVIEIEEVVEVDADFEGEMGEDGSAFGDEIEPMPVSAVGKFKWYWKHKWTKRQKIYGVVGLLLVLMFLPDGEPTKTTGKDGPKKAVAAKKKDQKSFTAEELELIDPKYQLAKTFVNTGKYSDAMLSLDELLQLTKGREYKQSGQLKAIAKKGLRRLEDLEKERRKEEQRVLRAAKVKDLVKRATKATNERRVELAEKLFSEIKQLDPENLDVSQLELDLKAWKDEEDRKSVAEAQIKSERRIGS